MVREDLNPVEEARACAALVEDLGLSREELARRVGRSRPAGADSALTEVWAEVRPDANTAASEARPNTSRLIRNCA